MSAGFPAVCHLHLFMQERIQKLIAAAGIASRRHAEELITAGQVTVNGQVITELGTKADPETDHIKVQKVYEAKVKGIPDGQAIERLRRGVTLEDGTRTAPAKIRRLGETETNAWFEILLHEGKNQQIRRMFDLIGHSVIKLRRSRIGSLRDDDLKPKKWRRLTSDEVELLMKKRPRTKSKPTAKSQVAGHGSTRR